MVFHRAGFPIKLISPSPTSTDWRTQIKQTQLVRDVSTILLQRHNWVPLLHSVNISPKLNPSLFHRILLRIQAHPQISLEFFNWAKSNAELQPNFKSLCTLIQILVQSGLSRSAIPILDSLIQNRPEFELVESLVRVCRGKDCEIEVLSFVLECYSGKGLCLESLKVFRGIRFHCFAPSICACNAMLLALEQKNETKLVRVSLACLIRCGVLFNKLSWSIISRFYHKDGKLGIVVRFLELGMCDSVIFPLVIDGCSQRGDFKSALDHLNRMSDKNLHPSFDIYSSVLDSAYRHGDVEVAEMVISAMVEKELLPLSSQMGYESIIQKLSELGKTYAAEKFFRKACEEKISIKDATYCSLLRAFSEEGRRKEAISLFHRVLKKRIRVNPTTCHAFANVLCNGDPSWEASELLRDMIAKGFIPRASDLSSFIYSHCAIGRWREAEDLLNATLEGGSLPNSFSCCSLMEHYCSSKQTESAIALHNKIERLKGSLDVKTYDILLEGLFAERKVEEAILVFAYMRTKKVVGSSSFSIMISGLCGEKELRKAMKLHDLMLEMGLKPDDRTYKRLISGFRL